MKERIAEIVEDYWSRRLPALMEFVSRRTRQIENLLSLEDFYRTGHKGEKLKKAMGGFGSDVLDIGSLSTVLRRGDGARTMEKERYNRVQALFGELTKLGAALTDDPPRCSFHEMVNGSQAIVDSFDTHIGPLAKTFRTLRIADVEARAKYDAELHDPFFEDFNWRHLDDEEMALCPPFVVFSEPDEGSNGYLAGLMELVTAGKPLKVVLLRSRLDNAVSETGRAAALKSASDAELLFISLRNVYFSQGSPAGPTALEDWVAGGLASPRPGVLSVLSGAADGNSGEARAELALASRAFPQFVYDPERAADFVSCLDLSENPELEQVWPVRPLAYQGEGGEPETVERPFTFADFAAGEPELAAHFSPLPESDGADGAVPLAEFLGLTADRRKGKTPYILSVDGQKKLVRLVPSQSMVAQTADKMHLWHTLQELGGIRNPFVQAAEQRAVQRLSEEKEQALSTQKTELEAQFAGREKAVVAAAMKNLALKLTGMAPVGASLEGPPAVAPQAAQTPSADAASATAQPAPAVEAPAPAAEEAPAAVSELPWIEPKLCTTCDECTTINKKIFVYNSDKKATIKDPRGGPFRDIVKSAEKCSSGAIHPGMPLDPNEKDLEKWIKRAEPFQ
ncbi:MAG: hypothetical protein V3S29_11560 [bacterium]